MDLQLYVFKEEWIDGVVFVCIERSLDDAIFTCHQHCSYIPSTVIIEGEGPWLMRYENLVISISEHSLEKGRFITI